MRSTLDTTTKFILVVSPAVIGSAVEYSASFLCQVAHMARTLIGASARLITCHCDCYISLVAFPSLLVFS